MKGTLPPFFTRQLHGLAAVPVAVVVVVVVIEPRLVGYGAPPREMGMAQ